MLVRYFRRPSRIEQLRTSTGGYLLEGFAKVSWECNVRASKLPAQITSFQTSRYSIYPDR